MNEEPPRKTAPVEETRATPPSGGDAAAVVVAMSGPRHVLAPSAQFGRFVIIAPLGSGGMGDVYKARDTLLARIVALKLLRLDFASSGARSSTAARLLREARAAAALNHPNAIAIFDTGEVGGTPYLAMEFVDGTTLRAIARRNDSALRDRVAWMEAVARVLAAAHALGIVHRDVKPENVMVRADGVVKVLDFGIARAISPGSMKEGPDLTALTTQGVAMGTLAYISPEQRRGEPPDPRSDQFAWGVTAYELLMGERPWGVEGWSVDAMVAARVAMRANSGVMTALQRVVFRALEGEAGHRFASMDALIEAMAADDGDADDLSIAPSPAQRSARWRWLPWLCFAATIVVYLFAALAEFRSPGPSARNVMTSAIESERPPSHVPRAIAAYAAGMQSERDDSIDAARQRFREAAEIDPSLAAAQIHFVLDAQDFGLDERDRLRRAYAARAYLGERDRQFVEALEPWSRDRMGLAETARRFAALAASHPDDADMLFHAARIQYVFGDYTASQAAANAAAQVDPGFVAAIGLHAAGLAALDRNEEATAEYERCLSVSPSAVSCLKHLMSLEANDGQCVRLEELSRRLIARDPTDPEAYRSLASALFARGAPREAVELALDEAASRAPEADRVAERARLDAYLFAVVGRFADAEDRARAWEAALEGRSHEAPHVEPARFRMRLALETGQTDVAAALARDYLRRRAGWTPDAWLDPRIEAYRTLYVTGRMSVSDMRAARRQVLAAGDPGIDPGDQWGWVYAYLVQTGEDAHEAFAALAPGTRLTPRIARSPRWEERLGLAFLRAGELDAAIAHLARGSGACTALTLPFEHTSTMYFLAEALDAKGRARDACAAYRAVVARWGAASPPSTTAQRAATRIARTCER